MSLAALKDKNKLAEKRKRKKRIIKHVLSNGKKSETQWLAGYYCQQKTTSGKDCNTFNCNVLCVIAKKRFLKKAIDRNCFKRVAKETFKEYLKEKINKTCSFIIVVEKRPERKSKKYFRQEIKTLLQKARI